MISSQAFQLISFAACFVTAASAGVAPSIPDVLPVITKAVAVLVPSGTGQSASTIIFEQATPEGPVTVTGNLGFDGPQGLHIHQLGDLTGGCDSAGPHFNPTNKTHGGHGDAERHVGDLGNVVNAEGSGAAGFSFEDSVISLNGPNSIIGRTVVVHLGIDDQGKTTHPNSTTTGNSGPRAACGIIGIAA